MCSSDLVAMGEVDMVGPNAVVAVAVVATEGVAMGVATVEVVVAALDVPTVL